MSAEDFVDWNGWYDAAMDCMVLFNSGRVAKVMKALDWKWAYDEEDHPFDGVPDAYMIRAVLAKNIKKAVARYVKHAEERSNSSSEVGALTYECGGLRIIVDIDEQGPFIKAEFIATSTM